MICKPQMQKKKSVEDGQKEAKNTEGSHLIFFSSRVAVFHSKKATTFSSL